MVDGLILLLFVIALPANSDILYGLDAPSDSVLVALLMSAFFLRSWRRRMVILSISVVLITQVFK